MSSQKEQIKQLLLADELALLRRLREKVLESEHFSDEVAKVLARATGKAWKNDPAYQSVLAKPIGEGLKTAIKREQRTIIDAFVPVMGPMIRASVSASIKKLMADINRVLELGLSPKALKWRWQSWKTGVPFAELVFLNTVEYQVQHAFLIDKHSGLLIEYAGHEEKLARDKDAFSAMLTAIGDFVADTLAGESSGRWRSAELGEHLLWIIDGPLAYLAVLIKGNPSERLREHLQDALDKIHVLYGDDLKESSEFGNLPAVRLELEDMLITRSRQEEGADQKKRRWPWLFLAVLLTAAGYGLWQAYQKNQLLQTLRGQLEQLPGFVLEDVRHTEDGILATGLLDPQAPIEPFIRQGVQFQTRPYLSLDPELVQTRINQLTETTGLTAKLDSTGTAHVHGQASDAALNELRLRLLTIPGVATVNTDAVITPLARWRAFVRQHPPPEGVRARFSEQQLTLEGQSREDQTASWLQRFALSFPHVQAITEKLRLLPDPQTLKNAIENLFVSMPEGTTVHGSLQEVIQTLRQWFSLSPPAGDVELVGQTDCTGTPEGNRRLAQSRADALKKALVAAGLPATALRTRVSPCTSQSSQQADPGLRGVRFKVVSPPSQSP